MAVIYTSYLGPTNYRPGRVKAVIANRRQSVTLPWSYELSISGNHRAAALALIVKMDRLAQGGWGGMSWIQGDAGEHGGYAFISDGGSSERFLVPETPLDA